ncbi:hypothetical protein Leryth_023783 [Lithospermum erythrorhizon]|nr:hypothetical protein Leryth_023783 [Lithospermum erythrorhizon]
MEIYEGSEPANSVVKQEIKVVSKMKNEKCDVFSPVKENEVFVVGSIDGNKENGNLTGEIKGNQESIDSDGANVDERCKDQFLVGDLVWGKIKSYPFWPGMIYDASDASDFALKFKNENKLLVAYFGDGSCAWCSPSQLVPFVEHYEKMAKQSSSKSFVSAIEEALKELGRRVELQIYCSCVPEGSLTDLSRPEATNAGVRSGVLMPNGASDKLPCPSCEPVELLEYARNLALASPVSNSLEPVLMKSWLSSFSRVKRGFLPIYIEPHLIEGLEDKSKNVVPDTNDFSVPIEVPIQGPSEEEWPSSQKALHVKGLMVTSTHKRKQKSVAELMREDKGVKPKIKNEIPHATELKKIEDPSDDVEEDSEEKTLKRFISRARKNSKYLSAPYTIPLPNLARTYSKREPGTKSDNIAKSAKVGDRLAKVAGQFISSTPLAKCNSASSKEKMSGDNLNLGAHVTNPQTINEKTAENCSMDISESADQVLAKVLCAGVNLVSMDRSSIEPLKGFMSAFRSSKFLNTSNFKLFHDLKSSKKRKLSVHEPGDIGNDLTNADVVSAQPAAHNEMIDKPRSRVSKFKKSARADPANKKEVDKTSPDALIISFGSNDSPSKEEIIKTLSKKRSMKHSASLQLTGDDVSQVDFAKQKLMNLTSLLNQCDGKISLEEKSNLEDEIRGLLQKVGELAVKTSS